MKKLFKLILVFTLLLSSAKCYAFDYTKMVAYESDSKIFLVGDFNDWKVPTDDSDNGAIRGYFYKVPNDFKPLESHGCYLLRYFPLGTQRVAIYDQTSKNFWTFSNLNPDREFSEMKNFYETSGCFTYGTWAGIYPLENEKEFDKCAQKYAFEITVTRDYGTWVEFYCGMNGIANLSISADSPDFSLEWESSDITIPEVEEDCTPTYFNLEGKEIPNPDKGVYIEKRGNSSKVLFSK